MGYVSIDSVCGATAMLLIKAGERDRALRVFEAVAVGAENETTYAATLTDPTGALRNATREARALLGDPQRRDTSSVDLEAVLQAALGHVPEQLRVDR
jgi:hypothetical protein